MKTAISIPDPLFEAGEALARDRGISRSELYATALSDYIEAQNSASITERINQAIEGVDTSIDEGLMLLQMLSLPKEEW